MNSQTMSVLKAYINNDENIKSICDTNRYIKRRAPEQLIFYDNSRLKVAKNSIQNRVTEIFNSIKLQGPVLRMSFFVQK